MLHVDIYIINFKVCRSLWGTSSGMFSQMVQSQRVRSVASAGVAGARDPTPEVNAATPKLAPQQHIVPQHDFKVFVNLHIFEKFQIFQASFRKILTFSSKFLFFLFFSDK